MLYRQLIYIYAHDFNFIKRFLFHRPDYRILRSYLTYVHVPVTQEDSVFDPVFEPEIPYWSEDIDSPSRVDVTLQARDGTVGDIVIPTSVEKCVLSVTYLYGNKTYKFFTRNLNFAWPPVKQKGDARFILPIKSAKLLNEKLEEVHEVTGKIKKYAGPYNDFFNQDVMPSDMFTYDDYKFLKITNLLGKDSVTPVDSFIRLPC